MLRGSQPRTEGCQGSRAGRSSAERRRDSENFGGGGGRGRIGSGGRRRPCCERRSAARRGARGPEEADRPRNGGGTLKISAAGRVASPCLAPALFSKRRIKPGTVRVGSGCRRRPRCEGRSTARRFFEFALAHFFSVDLQGNGGVGGGTAMTSTAQRLKWPCLAPAPFSKNKVSDLSCPSTTARCLSTGLTPHYERAKKRGRKKKSKGKKAK